MYKYPYQIANAFSKRKDPATGKMTLMTLGVENKLSLEEKGVLDQKSIKHNPMEYHDAFSRFPFVLIETISDPKHESPKPRRVRANVSAIGEADIIIEKTKAIIPMLIQAQLKACQAPSAELPAAYTVKLKMGTGLQGKTPAAILLADPSMEEKLKNQLAFLNKNLEKYPDNRIQAAAIENALELKKAGKLSASVQASSGMGGSSVIDIFTEEFKYSPSEIKDGKIIIHGIKIQCELEQNYPFKITIKEREAKWDYKKGVPSFGNDDSFTELSIALTMQDWVYIVKQMDRAINAFETYWYKHQRELVRQCVEAGRQGREKCELDSQELIQEAENDYVPISDIADEYVPSEEFQQCRKDLLNEIFTKGTADAPQTDTLDPDGDVPDFSGGEPETSSNAPSYSDYFHN